MLLSLPGNGEMKENIKICSVIVRRKENVRLMLNLLQDVYKRQPRRNPLIRFMFMMPVNHWLQNCPDPTGKWADNRKMVSDGFDNAMPVVL